MKTILLTAFFMVICVFSSVFSEEIRLINSKGEKLSFEVGPDDSFLSVMEQIADLGVSSETIENQPTQGQLLMSREEKSDVTLAFDFLLSDHFVFEASANHSMPPGTRDYYAVLTEQEKADIRKIVTTLGSSSHLGLWRHQSELEAAGNRIEHVHPLRFLEFVFTNEDLKVSIRSIRNKDFKVWPEFFGGLANSLEEESNYQNMKDEFIFDFATRLNINPNSIHQLIKQRQWEPFVDTLISIIPRKGNVKRYNM